MSSDEERAREALRTLISAYRRLSDEERREMTEASVVRQFIDRLLEEVLGWPIKDPARYKYELSTQVGRPDITLIPEVGGAIYLEAKRFGVIKPLEQVRYTTADTIKPQQMALPGMAVDRTPEEQQAINYAFANGSTWAILTNFEKLRLFNARRDWLVISFEDPAAYLHDFEWLWQLAYHNVLNGSLDLLSSQRHTEDVDQEYLAFINYWREKLAQDVIRHADQNPWVFDDGGRINLPLLRAVVQRLLDRLVIVRFAEDHFVIPSGTLRDFYELRLRNPYAQTMHQFLDDFFTRFDQAHNSALFAPNAMDRAYFSDDVLLPLISKLYEARYRAMPADILGNTYEQYLGKTLAQRNGRVETADNLETRKKQGSYYTPQVIVRYLVDTTLGRYLYGTQNGRADGQPLAGEQRKTAADIRDLRVLDAACGSGSFLIYAYEVLANFYESEIKRIEDAAEARRQELVAQGITSPLDLRIHLTPFLAERDRIQNYPRLILESHLYGVDLDPQAAEIAVVNLIMRVMERMPSNKRLPMILDQSVKVGNALVGLRGDDPRLAKYAPQIAQLIELRRQLIESNVPDKPKPASTPKAPAQRLEVIPDSRAISDTELLTYIPRPEYYPGKRLEEPPAEHIAILRQAQALAAEIYQDFMPEFAAHFSDLERVCPFHWGIEFPEVFFNDDGTPRPNAGFTIIFGNPPWEILKPDLREFYAQFDERIESKFTRPQVEKRIAELDAEDPKRRELYEAQTRLIEETAAYVRRSPDYTRQGKGDTATHKLFMERLYSLLQQGGRLGVVVPSGIYTDLGTKDLREMLLNEGRIDALIGLTNGIAGGAAYFPDIHRSFKITLLAAQKGAFADSFPALFRIDPRVTPHPDHLLAVVGDVQNYIHVKHDSIARFSPDSLSVMEFQTRRDYEIADKIYDGHPLLGEIVTGGWNVKFSCEFHMTNDRDLFNTLKRGLPLYEGGMIHQFDAFFREPEFWVDEVKGRERLANKSGDSYQEYRLAFRDIARATDERTLISAVLPKNVFCNNKTPLVNLNDAQEREHTLLYVCSLLNSFVLDFIIRQKISTTLNFFYMETLPLPRLTAGNPFFDAIVPRAARLTCTRPEFADLWRQVMGDEPPPYDPSPVSPPRTRGGAGGGVEDRQTLRNELDALVAHLYGLSREEFDHILGTFPLVFPENEEGQARRARLLAVYDEFAGRF